MAKTTKKKATQKAAKKSTKKKPAPKPKPGKPAEAKAPEAALVSAEPALVERRAPELPTLDGGLVRPDQVVFDVEKGSESMPARVVERRISLGDVVRMMAAGKAHVYAVHGNAEAAARGMNDERLVRLDEEAKYAKERAQAFRLAMRGG